MERSVIGLNKGYSLKEYGKSVGSNRIKGESVNGFYAGRDFHLGEFGQKKIPVSPGIVKKAQILGKK